jgi:predicted anti-sigma-YlaC factor YlaD
MDCDSIREAISASLDGEDADTPAGVTRAHLDECAACRAWQETQHALTRRARLTGYMLDHDLTERVLAALAVRADPAAGDPVAEVPVTRVLGLAVVAVAVAVAQLAVTMRLLSR